WPSLPSSLTMNQCFEYGCRSCLPLRGSSGFAPDSLFGLMTQATNGVMEITTRSYKFTIDERWRTAPRFLRRKWLNSYEITKHPTVPTIYDNRMHEAVVDQLTRWLVERPTPLLWVSGVAGAGKTAAVESALQKAGGLAMVLRLSAMKPDDA